MSGAPLKKLPTRPGVGSPSVPVADRSSEKVNVGFSDFGPGSSNQLRDPRLTVGNQLVSRFFVTLEIILRDCLIDILRFPVRADIFSWSVQPVSLALISILRFSSTRSSMGSRQTASWRSNRGNPLVIKF